MRGFPASWEGVALRGFPASRGRRRIFVEPPEDVDNLQSNLNQAAGKECRARLPGEELPCAVPLYAVLI